MANQKYIKPRGSYVTVKLSKPNYTTQINSPYGVWANVEKECGIVVGVGEDVRGLSANDEVIVSVDATIYKFSGFDVALIHEMDILAVVKK